MKKPIKEFLPYGERSSITLEGLFFTVGTNLVHLASFEQAKGFVKKGRMA
jgi:hypothetical protein